MTDQIKNRVVGAIVLFALAIIFLPKIFDGEKESQRREFVSIPKKPLHQQPAPKKENTAPTKIPEVVDETTDASVEDNSQANVTESKVVNKPVAATNAKAWVIRMGSFGNPTNVNAFVSKLRKKGFTAFSVPATPRNGVTNKVYVGPELNKSALTKLQPKLKKSFNERGVIERYQPNQ